MGSAPPFGSHEDVESALDREMRVPSASLAAMLIDVADVSRFQARLGYASSASLLQSLCDGFSNALGARGRIIRLGDGCFCAIVRSVRNRGHALLAAEKFARTADDLFGAAGVAVKPKINIGVALYPDQATQGEPLLRLAQLAVEASRNRASRIVVFDEVCDSEVIAPWNLGNEFAQALESGGLSVYYQPKVSMATGMPTGVEALMRWIDDGKPVATPDVFIPLAEEAGLIHAATWFSLSNALRMSAESGGLGVAVNITPGMLHHREFMDMVSTAISTWGVADERLTLEITEGALIADFAEATVRLKKLRSMGVRVSIDDFGTGYSSLSYFKKIPADELKIDKSFVGGMTRDAADHKLVRTIIGLAQHFNLAVVAEGVEDRLTFDCLADLGVHQAQGYLFSPALSAPRLRAWLADHSKDLRVLEPGVGSG
jgi:EAL domain-containing protein (putative c-di-GMP-specific phosphodiesterase class I)/GGDEF domain-containing protein